MLPVRSQLQGSFRMPTLPTFSVRFDEQQLVDLAAKARVQGTKRGYLHKSDSKLKKLSQRWCCVFSNLLFYFESESCTRPLGVVYLEGCTCLPMDQIGLPGRELEGTFCITSDVTEGASGNKTFFFRARSNKERDEWVRIISNANMSGLQQELEKLRQKCTQLESTLAISGREVLHLKEASLQAQEDISRLRNALAHSPNDRRHSSTPKCPSPSPPDNLEEHVKVLQGYIRGWLIRRRWKRIVKQYLESPSASMMKKRNQLIWKLVASEEDYVSQLTILNEEFRQQCEIAAHSKKPPITLEQCNDIFRNCNELLLFHQLLLRGLHSRIEKWPVVVFGDVLKLFIPMLTIYHQYVGNTGHAHEVLLTLKSDPSFASFLESIQAQPACQSMLLDDLLQAPLARISSYIQDLQDLRAHTHTDHVDYRAFHDTVTELEVILKTVTDEVNQLEMTRQVLRIERRIEGGCEVLLDKEQSLVREGVLNQVKLEDKGGTLSRSGKLRIRTQPRYCFLFTKHLLITTRVQKKPYDVYKLTKDGVLPLSQCRVYEHNQSTDCPELLYRGIKVDCSHGKDVTETTVLLANSINEKAEWLVDFSQCVESEKQNKILQSQSLGEPVELSSRFIRYNTFKSGKEQLVNCGTLDRLLQRLVKVSYFGFDFLNTFFLTFPLYTDAHTVMDFLTRSYYDSLDRMEKPRRRSMSPMDLVKDARAIQETTATRHPISPQGFLTVPSSSRHTHPPKTRVDTSPPPFHQRTASASSTSAASLPTINGIFFALKHWICKHFYHFREDKSLSSKLESLLDHAQNFPGLSPGEKSTVMEIQRLYKMQREAKEELCSVVELMKMDIHLPPKPYEVVLLWQPRETAEQLCYIESTLFCNIGNGEILRYFTLKGEGRKQRAPHLSAIFEHFNRMSHFFMWSVANQRYFVDRTKVLEFLIQLATECVQLNNFSSFMQIMSALDHGAIRRFKMAWEFVPKNVKQQYRILLRLSSTDGRYKELRAAMKKADPPSVPYLGIVLSEMSALLEGLATRIEDDLINFSKMRRCTRLIMDVLKFQKELYEFAFVPEISKILLAIPVSDNEDELYQFVETMEEQENAQL